MAENAKGDAKEPPPSPSLGMELDPGIRKAVEILQAGGIETFESCEGGEGHAFPEPTVRFHGDPAAGWKAIAICLARDLPVKALRRTWYVLDHTEPTGPKWEIAFWRRMR